MIDVVSEKDRRLNLWHTISKERLDDLEPGRLRDLGIYGGAQGIWVDKAHTAGPEIGPDGATIAVLHTGRHYADDLSDDGVIYHYPKTSRPPVRDAAEVQATIQCKPGTDGQSIGIRERALQPLNNAPHVEALRWRWEETQREWDRDAAQVAR